MKTNLGVVLLLFCAMPAITHAGFQGKQWKVKFESGTTNEIKKGSKMRASVSTEAIVFEGQSSPPLRIPVSSVSKIVYDTRSRKRTKEGIALMAASPLAGALLAGSKATKHFVYITSIDNGIEKELGFELGKNDYRDFLAELKTVTSKDWKDLPAERKKTEDEIATKKNQKISLKLDRKARVGDTDLKPGTYQLVLLERENNQGELHFFAGKKVVPSRGVAHTKVQVESSPANGPEAEAAYKEETAGVSSISAIKIPGRTLRIQ